MYNNHTQSLQFIRVKTAAHIITIIIIIITTAATASKKR